MLRDNHECLEMAANMTTVIELTPFFTCDALLTLIKKGEKRVTKHFVSCLSVYHHFGMSKTSLILACM